MYAEEFPAPIFQISTMWVSVASQQPGKGTGIAVSVNPEWCFWHQALCSVPWALPGVMSQHQHNHVRLTLPSPGTLYSCEIWMMCMQWYAFFPQRLTSHSKLSVCQKIKISYCRTKDSVPCQINCKKGETNKRNVTFNTFQVNNAKWRQCLW